MCHWGRMVRSMSPTQSLQRRKQWPRPGDAVTAALGWARAHYSSRHSSGLLSQGLYVLPGCIWFCSQAHPVLLIRKTRTVPSTHQSLLLIYGVCTVRSRTQNSRYTKDLSRKRTSKNSASVSGHLPLSSILLSQVLLPVIIIDLGVWRDCKIMDS